MGERAEELILSGLQDSYSSQSLQTGGRHAFVSGQKFVYDLIDCMKNDFQSQYLIWQDLFRRSEYHQSVQTREASLILSAIRAVPIPFVKICEDVGQAMCRAVADVEGQHASQHGSILDRFEATCQSLLEKVATDVPELDWLCERVDLSLRSFNRARAQLGQICQSLIAGYFFHASGFRWFQVNGTGKLVHCNSYGCIRDHDTDEDALCRKLEQVLEDAPEAFWLNASEGRPRETEWRGKKVEVACSFEHDLEGPLSRHLISAEVAERYKQGLEFWGVSDSSSTALKCAVGFTYYYFGLAEILASRSTAAMFALASDNYSEEYTRCRQFLQGHRPLKLLESAVSAHCESTHEDDAEAEQPAKEVDDDNYLHFCAWI